MDIAALRCETVGLAGIHLPVGTALKPIEAILSSQWLVFAERGAPFQQDQSARAAGMIVNRHWLVPVNSQQTHMSPRVNIQRM